MSLFDDSCEEEVLKAIAERFCVGGHPSHPFKVSTMMATCSFNQAINLRNLALFIPAGNIIYDPHSRALMNAKGAPKKSFHNQACVELCIGNRRINASIFSNGTVKFTGVQSEDECARGCQLLLSRIKRACGVGNRGEKLKAVADPLRLTLSKPEVGMIKCDLDIGFPISLEHALPLFQQRFPGSSFEPEVYCGLKVLVPLDASTRPAVTVCVFHTGKAFVSGKLSLDEVSVAFGQVVDVLNANKAHLAQSSDSNKSVSSTSSLSGTETVSSSSALVTKETTTTTKKKRVYKKKQPQPQPMDSSDDFGFSSVLEELTCRSKRALNDSCDDNEMLTLEQLLGFGDNTSPSAATAVYSAKKRRAVPTKVTMLTASTTTTTTMAIGPGGEYQPTVLDAAAYVASNFAISYEPTQAA